MLVLGSADRFVDTGKETSVRAKNCPQQNTEHVAEIDQTKHSVSFLSLFFYISGLNSWGRNRVEVEVDYLCLYKMKGDQ